MTHGYRELRRLVEQQEFRNPYEQVEKLPFKALVRVVYKLFWQRLRVRLGREMG